MTDGEYLDECRDAVDSLTAELDYWKHCALTIYREWWESEGSGEYVPDPRLEYPPTEEGLDRWETA